MKKLLLLLLGAMALFTALIVKSHFSNSSANPPTGSTVTQAEASKTTQQNIIDASSKGLTEIPSNILSNSTLTELNLSRNALTVIPPEIAELAKLKVLRVDNNKLSGTLESGVGSLQELLILSLHGNQLTSLPPEIGNLHKLIELDVSSNKLTSLPAELMQLKQLVKLNISGNNIPQGVRDDLKRSLPSTTVEYGP